MGRRGEAFFWLVVVGCAALGAALVFDHARGDSPTMDEPFHALAAAEYVLSGTCYANLEHPPLTKLLSGASLAAAGARPPRISRPFDIKTSEQPVQWAFSGRPLSPDALFAAARRPFPILFVLLVVLTGLLARHLAGAVAGAGAAAIMSFEPTALAHAGVVHTDVAAAVGFTGTVLLGAVAIERRSLRLWGATGAALGLALASKFTCVFLVPVLLVAALVALLLERRRAGSPPAGRGHPLAGVALAFAVALAVLFSVYAVALRGMTASEAQQAVRFHLATRPSDPATARSVAAISGAVPPLGHYLAGLAGISGQNAAGGGVNVLRGQLSVEGFWDYFFVAFAVKSATAFLALLAGALAFWLLRRPRLPASAVVLVLLSVVTLFSSGMASSYNIGIRHMLPAYPLLAALGAAVLVRALAPSRGAAALAVLAALELAEVARVHPHELSFFNLLAGGPENGEAWLNDSNLDWGQDLGRLGAALARQGAAPGTVTVAYFGGADPRAYLPAGVRLFDGATTPLDPGLYAVSSMLLAVGPELLALRGQGRRGAGTSALRDALRSRGEPVGRVGYSIHLVRLRAPS